MSPCPPNYFYLCSKNKLDLFCFSSSARRRYSRTSMVNLISWSGLLIGEDQNFQIRLIRKLLLVDVHVEYFNPRLFNLLFNSNNLMIPPRPSTSRYHRLIKWVTNTLVLPSSIAFDCSSSFQLNEMTF